MNYQTTTEWIEEYINTIHIDNKTDDYNKAVVASDLEKYLAKIKPGYEEAVSKGAMNIPLLAKTYGEIKERIDLIENALERYYSNKTQ